MCAYFNATNTKMLIIKILMYIHCSNLTGCILYVAHKPPSPAFMQGVADKFCSVWQMLGALLVNDEEIIARVQVSYHAERPGYHIKPAAKQMIQEWSDLCCCSDIEQEHTCLTVLTALVLLGKQEAMARGINKHFDKQDFIFYLCQCKIPFYLVLLL